MEGYKTLTEAAAMAMKVCSSWYGDETEETYGVEELSYIAQIADLESPNTSEELFYVVFPDGEIGLLSTYDRGIRRLFIPSDSDFVPKKRMLLNEHDEMTPDEAMPHEKPFREDAPEARTQKEYRFCIYCGTKVQSRYKFCPNCGKRIEVR